MDGFQQLIKSLNLPFYVTGGTALSRHYLQHRYSDDLDLFVNNDPLFNQYLEILYKELTNPNIERPFVMDLKRLFAAKDYLSLYLISAQSDDPIQLKIDLVNDQAPHYGEFETNPLLGKVDSWRNILSNKLTAIYRYEPKDVIDILAIAEHYPVDWKEIVHEAKTKDPVVDPIDITEIIRSMPIEKISTIKFIEPLDLTQISAALQAVSEDIFYGRKTNKQLVN
jgi:predicted nucleotidyltransferase component of viral defense system